MSANLDSITNINITWETLILVFGLLAVCALSRHAARLIPLLFVAGFAVFVLGLGTDSVWFDPSSIFDKMNADIEAFIRSNQ